MNFLSNLYKPITEIIKRRIVSGNLTIESDMLYYFVIDMQLNEVVYFIDTKKSFDEYCNMDLYNDGFFSCEDIITPYEEELLSINSIKYDFVVNAVEDSRLILVPYTIHYLTEKSVKFASLPALKFNDGSIVRTIYVVDEGLGTIKALDNTIV